MWKIFSTCGVIEHIYIVRNQETGIPQGSGWIVFMTEDGVNKAVKLNEPLILNYPVIVRIGYFVRFFNGGEKEVESKVQIILEKYNAKQN